MSRQYDWQQHRKKLGACQQCGDRPVLFFTSLCVPCGMRKRRGNRQRMGARRLRDGGPGRPWKGTQ